MFCHVCLENGNDNEVDFHRDGSHAYDDCNHVRHVLCQILGKNNYGYGLGVIRE